LAQEIQHLVAQRRRRFADIGLGRAIKHQGLLRVADRNMVLRIDEVGQLDELARKEKERP
jgi:hypothetical protein